MSLPETIRVIRFTPDAFGRLRTEDKRFEGEGKPGDLWLSPTRDTTWLFCPGCGRRLTPRDHDLTEEAEGTITMNAAILCPHEECHKHYYIRQNKIWWF